MSKVISFASGRRYSVEQLLKIVDDLRESIESGETIAFAAVGIGADNRPARWYGASRVVSPLTMTGAIASLQHNFVADHDGGGS